MSPAVVRFALRLLACALAPAATAQAEAAFPPLRLVTQDWPPYAAHTSHGDVDGLAITPVRCALEDMRVAHRIEIRPWARAQAEAKEGRAQGFFPASRSNARDVWASLSDPVAHQNWVWILRADDMSDPNADAFRRHRTVSTAFGSNMHAWLNQENFRLVAAPYDVASALRLVVEGRSDAVLANEQVARRQLAQLGLERHVRQTLHSERPLGLYVTKAYLATAPGFLEAFNDRLAACRARMTDAPAP